MRKVIITVATTGGVHRKSANPNLPEQPNEIAESAYESFNAGSAIVHIHARDKDGNPSGDPKLYQEIKDLIRAKCNIIIQFSTGGGGNLTIAQRCSPLDAKPEMASLNMGTLVRTVGPYAGTLFSNSPFEIEQFAQEMHKRDIKPEMEVYHHGMMREVENLIKKGLVERPYYVNFVMGMGYQGAASAVPENLFSLKQLLPPDSIFDCCGIGPAEFPMITLSLLLGGHVRVGMEDNIYYSKGVLTMSNAQLVEKAVRLISELGMEVANPDEARDILRLKR